MQITPIFHTIFQQLIRPTPRGLPTAQTEVHEQFNSRSVVRDVRFPLRFIQIFGRAWYMRGQKDGRTDTMQLKDTFCDNANASNNILWKKKLKCNTGHERDP